MKKSKILIMILAIFLVPISLAYWFLFEPVIKVDVVVIGAGASGMSAALEAESQGASVILLEKMPYVGGNTVRATAGMNAVFTTQQRERGIEDSRDIFLKDIMESGHGLNSVEMIEVLIDNSADAINWLTDLGADLDDVGILAGHTMARTHRPSGGQPVGNEIVKTLSNAIKESSVDLRLEHKAVEIGLDRDGKIKEVQVIDRTGKSYTIRCQAVVIATGGFGGSSELFVNYNPMLKGYHTTNSPSATGDFISLVDGIDAKFTDMKYIQTHPTVSPQYGMLITEAIRGNGGILVNNQGVRFADEMKNRDYLSEDLLAQPEREVYLIFNEDIRQTLAASDDYIDMDIILYSSTIEGLAHEIRVDPSTLVETIDRYNGFVYEQTDIDFNRHSLKTPLTEGPFYAIQVIPGVHYCMGGILIDTEAKVIGTNNLPIQGLFAAGEATGGIHGLNRLGGNSLLDAIVYGRIAGENAANMAK